MEALGRHPHPGVDAEIDPGTRRSSPESRRAMLDLPERGAPFRTTIRPGGVKRRPGRASPAARRGCAGRRRRRWRRRCGAGARRAAVAAFGRRGGEHGAGQHQERELADEEGRELGGGERVRVLDIGEVGAAAEDAPAGEGGEGGDGRRRGGGGSRRARPATQSPRWRRPQSAAFWPSCGGADGDGVEHLLGLGEAGGAGDHRAGAVAGQAEGLGERVEVDQVVAPAGVGEEVVRPAVAAQEVAVGLVEDQHGAVARGRWRRTRR